MKRVKELQAKIEASREELHEAIGKGYDEKRCRSLSQDLDRLIEEYITLDPSPESG